MNIATLIRYGKGTFEDIWKSNQWFAHGSLVEIARQYGVGMTVIATETDFEKICAQCDGLIVPGSPINIEPTYYGGAPLDPPNEVDEYALDSKVIAAFAKQNKPIFGICGGHQALNVFFGGTLGKVADMRSANYEKHENTGALTDRYGYKVKYNTHMVNIIKGSFMYDVYGAERVQTNSYHSWAVEQLAEGFEVVARSDDGIVEAIECREKNIFATQFHPELGIRTGNSTELKFFENFFRVCAENTKK